MRTHLPFSLLLAVLAAASVAGCGGSGSTSGSNGGAVSGLSMPDSLSVVTASGATGGGSTIAPGAGTGEFPADCEFFTDPSFAHVWDRSIEPLEVINEILEMTSQTAADEMVNQGAYRALIDASRIGKGSSGGGGSQSGQSSSSAQEFEDWTVRSAREDNSEPMMVRIWIPQEDEFMSGLIYALGRVYEEPSDQNPFGRFEMTFAMKASFEGPLFFKGMLQTEHGGAGGQIGFSFYEEGGKGLELPHDPGEFSEVVQVRVNMSRDQSTGLARVRQRHRENFGNGDTGILSEEYLIAFDDTHFLRQAVGESAVLYHRDQFDRRTWRYNLYDALGENIGNNVEVNSGFGFRTDGGGFGWIGYWGMWAPEGVTIANGDTIYREQRGPGAGEPEAFTVVQAPGRLIKNSKNTLALAEVDNEEFRYWAWDPMTYLGAEFKVLYTHINGTFWKTHQWDEQNREWIELGAPEAIVLQPGDWLHLWSDGLGGSVNYVYGETTITFWKEEFVAGDNGDLFPSGVSEATLYGMIECLRSEITGPEAELGDIFLPEASVADPYLFRFGQGDLALFHDVNGDGLTLTQVGLGEGEEPTAGPYMWGMRSGPLLPAHPSSYGTIGNPWDAWNVDVFYLYETGHNAWNRMTTLLDAQSAPVSFDPPLTFTYTHSTDNDANGDPTWDGKVAQFEYNGNGDLWGIPQEELDLNGDGRPDRWIPRYSMLDGVPMGPTGVEYVVKAIETELHLREDTSGSTALTLDGASALVLPNGSGFSNPATVERPTVTGPPAVIAGVVQ